MKRLLFISVLYLVSLNCYADPNKVAYELSRECSKDAEDSFKKDYGDGQETSKEERTIYGYTNHYNSRLNKCFILITSSTFYKHTKDKPKSVTTVQELYDLNDKKEYASYYGDWNVTTKSDDSVLCNVQQKPCKSANEFKELIKPYMEE